VIYLILDNHGIAFECVKPRTRRPSVNAFTIKEFLDSHGFNGWTVVQCDLSDWEETKALLNDIDEDDK
jgi:hypothetical protein